jgi:hypothetical protein
MKPVMTDEQRLFFEANGYLVIPEALDAAELARLCRRLGGRAQPAPALAVALRAASERALGRGEGGSGQGIVCVTGSLLLVGQARDALGVPVAERLW